jgi:hypothetical protein
MLCSNQLSYVATAFFAPPFRGTRILYICPPQVNHHMPVALPVSPREIHGESPKRPSGIHTTGRTEPHSRIIALDRSQETPHHPMTVQAERPLRTNSHEDMIHIVGLYKCGTSWLLHMLAAHPQVAALREFDAIRAAYAPNRQLWTLPAAALDYAFRRPASARWMQRREASTARVPHAVFREMFAGRGLIPVMGADKQSRAASLPLEDLAPLLDQLLELGGFKVRRSDGPLINPNRHSNTLGVMNFRRADLLALMEAVRDCGDAQQAPKLFFASLCSQVQPGARIACKAADQVMQFAALKRASPGSRAIAIIRDGRDAAVSARHFESLMRKREAPWATARASYSRRLLGWSLRAAKLAEHARRGDVLVLRYEDLRSNFVATCSALLEKLELDSSPEIVDHIHKVTDFSAVADGRQPGESAEHIVRKGSVGEWKDDLSPGAAPIAWKLVGKELQAFGYRPDGAIEASPLVLGHSERLMSS